MRSTFNSTNDDSYYLLMGVEWPLRQLSHQHRSNKQNGCVGTARKSVVALVMAWAGQRKIFAVCVTNVYGLTKE